ncbi:MAG: alcohol dehydrogenase catalytic domain-containing protein, partial [Pseudomonadota bacterium]
MADIPKLINTWQMVEGPVIDKETRKVVNPGRLEKTQIPMPELGPNEALVKVAGCGVCHTDLGYFYDGVPTVNKPPLALGHEISGTVAAGPDHLVGRNVIVPAVLPCNNCPICEAGRGNRCLSQKMPGNSLGIYGGFSDYIPVPADDLCLIDDLQGLPLSHYAVVADAVTTPYQAAMRAEIKAGDLVMIFGAVGGVGTYVTQTVKALGAKVVVALDINQEKLENIRRYGADFIINVKDKDLNAVRDEFRAIAKQAGVPSNFGWKIFEVTG